MGTPDPFQLAVARIALSAARDHGFALAGGHALIAHGIVSRPTRDVDLFTDHDQGVRAATAVVDAALVDAGFVVQAIAETSELGEVFYGFDRNMVEFEVRRDEQVVRLQLVYFDRGQQPVVLDIGPVLHLDDVIGSKVAAMAVRVEPRDLIDIAAAQGRYTRQQLIELGCRSDPALTDEEFIDAMRRLDRLDNEVFELYGLDDEAIRELRDRFADWPR